MRCYPVSTRPDQVQNDDVECTRPVETEESPQQRLMLMEDEVKDLAAPDATIEIDEVTGWHDSEPPLRVKCHLRAPHFAVLTSRRMLFPLSVFQANSKNPFPQVYRTQPVYFGHGYRITDKVEISLPGGYRLEALPPESQSAVTTDFAEFQAKRSSEAGAVRLERHTEMKGNFFPVQSYASLRAHFQKVRQVDAQNVVLVKEVADHAH